MQLSSTWSDSSVTSAHESNTKEQSEPVPLWMLYLLAAVVGIVVGALLWAMYPQLLVIARGFDWVYLQYAAPAIISLLVLYVILSRSYAVKPYDSSEHN